MKLGKKTNILTLVIFLLTMSFSLASCAEAPLPEKTRIMCYGDSNTWGWMPVENIPTTRYASNVRWTGVLQKELGDKYQVVEEGLNGRTTGADDYANGLDESITKDLNLNGRPSLLPILKSQLPLKLVVIMLGTNDVKTYLNQEPAQIADSMQKLVTLVNTSVKKETEWDDYSVPRVLIVAPTPVRKGISAGLNELFAGGDKPSAQLGKLYAEVAKTTGADFFDASTVIPVADGADGIHLSAEAHNKLGLALAEKIKTILKK